MALEGKAEPFQQRRHGERHRRAVARRIVGRDTHQRLQRSVYQVQNISHMYSDFAYGPGS